MEHIAGVKTLGHSAVKGIFTDEVQGAPLKGVDLVIDKDIAGAGQGQQKLKMIVKMEPAHMPGLVVVELKVELYIGHIETSVHYH